MPLWANVKLNLILVSINLTRLWVITRITWIQIDPCQLSWIIYGALKLSRISQCFVISLHFILINLTILISSWWSISVRSTCMVGFPLRISILLYNLMSIHLYLMHLNFALELESFHLMCQTPVEFLYQYPHDVGNVVLVYQIPVLGILMMNLRIPLVLLDCV